MGILSLVLACEAGEKVIKCLCLNKKHKNYILRNYTPPRGFILKSHRYAGGPIHLVNSPQEKVPSSRIWQLMRTD